MTETDAQEIKAILKEIRDWQLVNSEPLWSSLRRRLYKPFRFNLSAALMTMTWLAIWCAAASWSEPHQPPILQLWLFLLITPPAAAMGAFLNQPLVGFLCGATSGVAVAIWAAVMN
jgi:hypothetical protein